MAGVANSVTAAAVAYKVSTATATVTTLISALVALVFYSSNSRRR